MSGLYFGFSLNTYLYLNKFNKYCQTNYSTSNNGNNIEKKNMALPLEIGLLNDLYNVIDRVSTLTSDKEKNIVTLETQGNTLILKSSSVEIGRVEEKMTINKNNDEDIKISFSASISSK